MASILDRSAPDRAQLEEAQKNCTLINPILSKLNITKTAMGKPRDPVFPSPRFANGVINLKNPSLVKGTIFTQKVNAKFNLIITSKGVIVNPGTQSLQKGI